MKKNFKALSFAALILMVLGMISCGKEDEVIEPTPVVNNNITENTTWTKDVVHTITGRVVVEPGVTLTIEAGTVIKGAESVGENASVLIVARGAKIMALGTATEPIIFTSELDAIVSGQVVSPNMQSDQEGLWGGVVILGSAPCSFQGDVTEASIEGIPATDANGKFGGSNEADNSGVLSYVSIRHGGANIGQGNEINGLTLGGVGSGTVISNIEIVGNQDDGIEFFGGTVDVTNAIVWNNGDDAIDTDMAWSGTLNNVVIVNPGDEAFELDGPEGSFTSTGHTIVNGTVFAGSADGLIEFDANSDVYMNNIFFTDLSTTIDQNVENFDLYVTNGVYTSSTWEANIPSGKTVSDYFLTAATITASVDTANTVGAGLTVYAGWSWTAISSGKF